MDDDLTGEVTAPNNTIDALNERINKAIDLAFQYGGIDGGHHKMWVIDQMLRVLARGDYEILVAEACDGKDGPDTYEWDVGIAP